jgi:dolichol kinase
MIIGGIAVFIYTLQNKEEKREENLFTNELLVGLLFVLSGILFPWTFQSHSQTLPPATLNFLWFSTSLLLTIEVLVWSTVLMINNIKSKKDKKLMEERNYKNFSKHFLENWEYDFKKDVERKFLHLLPVFVILFFWTLGMVLDSLNILAIWGLDIYSFAFWLIITVGFGFCVMFLMADLARLNRYHWLPDWAREWYKKSMKPDELNTFISSAPLVLSFVPFVFAPFPIFAAVALITAVADAAASLVGKKYGKRKFNENSVKTIEGYIAGASMTFLIVVIVSGVYIQWMAVNLVIIISMALIASIIFFFVDAFFSKNITDNILNPLGCGIGMWFILLIL